MLQKREKKSLAWWPVLLVLLAFALVPLIGATTLNNPHTKAGYPGWQETQLPGMTVLLPPEWSLSVGEEDVPGRRPLTLTGKGGEVLAEGFLFPSGMGEAAFSAATEAMAGVPLSEYRSTGGFEAIVMGRGGSFRRGIFFSDDVKVLDTHSLMLRGDTARLHLWFPYCEGAEYNALADYARAIISAFRK